MKKKKTKDPRKSKKFFAVFNPAGDICLNLISKTQIECVEKHEMMFPGQWLYYKKCGFSIRTIRIK
jgi:signal recognition particle subunit SEC65